MMREIKFRGLIEYISRGKREWVFYGVGSKPSLSGAIWIVEDEQFTGLRDSKGVDVYEGDVVRLSVGKHEWTMIIKSLDSCKDGPLYGVEIYCNFNTTDDGRYVWEENKENAGRRYEIPFLDKSSEVIGTIHDAEYKELAK